MQQVVLCPPMLSDSLHPARLSLLHPTQRVVRLLRVRRSSRECCYCYRQNQSWRWKNHRCRSPPHPVIRRCPSLSGEISAGADAAVETGVLLHWRRLMQYTRPWSMPVDTDRVSAVWMAHDDAEQRTTQAEENPAGGTGRADARRHSWESCSSRMQQGNSRVEVGDAYSIKQVVASVSTRVCADVLSRKKVSV